MARHAKDLNAILEVESLWENLSPGDDVFIFSVGDTEYTIRRIDYGRHQWIVDSQDVYQKDVDSRVRYILNEDKDIWTVDYILPEHRFESRCRKCRGIKYAVPAFGDSDQLSCEDCGDITGGAI